MAVSSFEDLKDPWYHKSYFPPNFDHNVNYVPLFPAGISKFNHYILLLVRNCLQILLLILSKFKQLN